MSNVSLARIMYGTSEERRASGWMNEPLRSAYLPISTNGSAARQARLAAGATNDTLLQKVWSALSGR